MDDRTWYLALGSLILALFGIGLDAALKSFDLPGGLWGFLSALLGFLGARSYAKAKNGSREEDETGGA